MQIKEKFYLEDLLYSLMLESHNDSAVAIAEHVGGSVKEFAKMMNAKSGGDWLPKNIFYHTERTGCFR